MRERPGYEIGRPLSKLDRENLKQDILAGKVFNWCGVFMRYGTGEQQAEVLYREFALRYKARSLI